MLQFYLSFGRTQNFQVFSPPVTAYAVTAPSSEGAFALMYFLDRLKGAILPDGSFEKQGDHLTAMGSEASMAKMVRTEASETRELPPSTMPELMCFLAA